MNAPEKFSVLLDATTIGDEEAVVLLRAYSDASSLRCGIFSGAAVGFGLGNAKYAEKEWVKLYGERHGHMTDMNARKKAFKGLDKEETDKLCRGSVEIINGYASYVAVIACDATEVVPSLPKTSTDDGKWLLDVYRGIYPACMHWTLHAFGDLIGPE